MLTLLSTQALADDIVIYIWEEYVSDQVIAQFERETGHKVKQVYFENEQRRDEVVLTEKSLAYDLFIIDGYSLNANSSSGIAKDLSSKEIINLNHIDKNALENCGNLGVPYSWGTMGIGYRTSKFSTPITSWSQVFSAMEQGKEVLLPSDDIDTIGVALLSLGLNPMTEDESDLKQAYHLLLSHKNSIVDFRAPVAYALEHRQNSTMEMAVIYSGETYTISQATEQDDWVYTVPEQGSLLWYECFAAPLGKPISEATLAFLEYINRPEIAAQNAEDVWVATTNTAALEHTSSEYLEDRELFPDSSTINRSHHYFTLNNSSSKLRARIISIIDK